MKCEGYSIVQSHKFMDFSSLFAIYQSAGLFFIFYNLVNVDEQSSRKSWRITKNSLFRFFWIFLIRFEVFSPTRSFLKVVIFWFLGSRTHDFGKIHDLKIGPRLALLFVGVLPVNHMGGEMSPPQANIFGILISVGLGILKKNSFSERKRN